jgi:hypothetical protein
MNTTYETGTFQIKGCGSSGAMSSKPHIRRRRNLVPGTVKFNRKTGILNKPELPGGEEVLFSGPHRTANGLLTPVEARILLTGFLKAIIYPVSTNTRN